jgi:hypothetical protein
MLANIQFLLALANDSHRVITSIVNSLVRASPAVAASEAVLNSVLVEFTQILDVSCRQVARCLFSGITNLVLDFDTSWVNGTDVLKSITTALNYSFRDIEKCSESACYLRLLGICADICATRYLLMLRERVSAATAVAGGVGNPGAPNATNANLMSTAAKLTSAELDRVLEDVDHFLAVFDVASIIEGFRSSNAALSGPSFVDAASPEKGALANSAHICIATHLTQYETSVLVRLCTAVTNMRDLRPLLTSSFETEAFSSNARAVVRRYRIAAMASSFTNVAGPFLLCLVSSLRPDSCSALQTLTNVILEHHGSRLSGGETNLHGVTSFGGGSSTMTGGSATGSFNTNKASAQPQAANDVQSPVHVQTFDDSVDFCDDPISRVFGTRNVSDDVSEASASTGVSNTPTSTTATPVKSKKPLISTPFTLKQLREKTSDVLNTFTHRRPDTAAQHAHELMRFLGLEEDAAVTTGGLGTDDFTVAPRMSSASNLHNMDSDTSHGNSFGAGGTAAVDAIVSSKSVSAVSFSLGITDLKIRGLNSGSMFSAPNPYVAIILGEDRQKTPVLHLHGAITGAWPATTKLSFRGHGPRYSSVSVQVFDKELVRRKRILGSVTVSILGVEDRAIEGWFALDGGEAGSKAEIYMRIQLESQ